MREMRGTRAAWCARGGRAAAAVQRRSGAGERRWRGAARCGAGGGVARGTSGAARTKGLLAKGFLRKRKKYPSTLVIAAQRPASSFRGRIVLQLPRSLLLLARLQTVLPRDGVVVPRRGDGRDRDAHNNGGFTRATRCQRNGRRDCAAAIRVGGVQEHRQLAAFRDCGSSRASAFTLGAGRWGSNAAALPVVTRVARVARIASHRIPEANPDVKSLRHPGNHCRGTAACDRRVSSTQPVSSALHLQKNVRAHFTGGSL